jgi:hemerythrin superfamily protein
MLTDDHRRVKEIFDTFKELDDHEKIEAKHKALVELALHAAVEEKLVYPLLRNEGEEDEVNEAFVEHHVVKLLIVELETINEADAMLDAKFKVLGEIVDHHVKEEESVMFPKLRASDNNLQELGAEIKSKKEQLLAQLGDADDLGRIDPELSPRSTRNDRGTEEEHSNGNERKGSSEPKAKKANTKKTAKTSSTSAKSQKVKTNATASQTKTRAKAAPSKPVSTSGKRAASSSSKVTAKSKKPSSAVRKASPAKKTAKKKSK